MYVDVSDFSKSWSLTSGFPEVFGGPGDGLESFGRLVGFVSTYPFYLLISVVPSYDAKNKFSTTINTTTIRV